MIDDIIEDGSITEEEAVTIFSERMAERGLYPKDAIEFEVWKEDGKYHLSARFEKQNT